MDNGWTVSISQSLSAGSTTGLGMTIDMGDAGTLNFESDKYFFNSVWLGA